MREPPQVGTEEKGNATAEDGSNGAGRAGLNLAKGRRMRATHGVIEVGTKADALIRRLRRNRED